MNLVRDIFPDGHRPDEGQETDQVLAEYREAYGRNWKNTTRPYEGINELLDTLTEQQIPIGVLSNKAHDFTEKCVDAFLSNWNWDVVLGAREGIPKKPDPAGAIEAAERLWRHRDGLLVRGRFRRRYVHCGKRWNACHWSELGISQRGRTAGGGGGDCDTKSSGIA